MKRALYHQEVGEPVPFAVLEEYDDGTIDIGPEGGEPVVTRCTVLDEAKPGHATLVEDDEDDEAKARKAAAAAEAKAKKAAQAEELKAQKAAAVAQAKAGKAAAAAKARAAKSTKSQPK